MSAVKSVDPIQRIVTVARDQLEMDLAFLASVEGARETFRAVAGDGASFDIRPGERVASYDLYCRAVLDESIPNVYTDARTDPHTRDLAVTHASDIGAYVGVPVRLPNGEVYGTLCCLSHQADESRGERDVRFLTVLAALLGELLESQRGDPHEHRLKAARVRGVLDRDALEIALQPIVDLHSLTLVGAEALARFPDGDRTPDVWFGDAADVGLGLDLELRAVERAIALLPEIPAPAYLSVNVSAPTAASPELASIVGDSVVDRIVVEVTEHAVAVSEVALGEALAALRARGARIAVDDVGVGFSNLRNVLQLAPDILKLDRSLVHDLDVDGGRRALAAAFASFAAEIGASIVAEGIERQAEADAVLGLGVMYGQGYHLGRPTLNALAVDTTRPHAPRVERPRARTVLVCDDEDPLRAIVRGALSDLDCTVIDARDGRAALALARSVRPDLIVLDRMMPHLTGLDVLREIRADEALARTPVVMLTARAQASDLDEARTAGADVCMTKPFSPSELRARVTKLLDGGARRD